MEIYNKSNMKFKIVVLRKLSELQENIKCDSTKSVKQYKNKKRSLTDRSNKKKILELKDSMNEIKN